MPSAPAPTSKWPDRLGVAGLYLYAFSAFFSTFAMNAGMQLMALAALLRWRKVWEGLQRRPLFWLALTFALYVAGRGQLAGIEFPTTRGAQGNTVSDLILGNGLPLLLAAYWVGGQQQRMERALLLATGGLLVLITLKHAWGTLVAPSLERLTLDMSPNGLALIAATLLWGSLVFALRELARGVAGPAGWARPAGLTLLAALGMVLLTHTGSRAAWLATALVMPLLGLVYLWRLLPPARRAGGLAAFAVILAGAAALGAWAGADLVASRVTQAREATGTLLAEGSTAVDDTSIGARLRLWHEAMQRIVERPLLGWGPGSAHMLIAQAQAPEIRDYPHFHNLPLHLTVTLGALGCLLYFAVLAAILWEAVAARRAGHLSIELFFLAVGGYALFLLASLFEYRLGRSTSQFLLILVGLAALAGDKRGQPA